MFFKLVNLISERERISQKNNQSRFWVKKNKKQRDENIKTNCFNNFIKREDKVNIT